MAGKVVKKGLLATKEGRRKYQRRYYREHEEHAKAYQRRYNLMNKRTSSSAKDGKLVMMTVDQQKARKQTAGLSFNSHDLQTDTPEKMIRRITKWSNYETDFTGVR